MPQLRGGKGRASLNGALPQACRGCSCGPSRQDFFYLKSEEGLGEVHINIAEKTVEITDKYQFQDKFDVAPRGTGTTNAKKKRMRKFLDSEPADNQARNSKTF